MERKIISKESLSDLFARNEIEAATLLRDALMDVKEKVGNITDPDIKNYNADAENKYMLDISLTTIKNYAAKYGYGVFNVVADACVVKQFCVDDYREMKKKLENKGDTIMETNNNNLTATQRLAINFVEKADEYKVQDVINIRCASTVQTRLQAAYAKYDMFSKQFLISYLLDKALTELEDSEEK